ncbi:MAG: nucleoside hydrolase, partial [Bacteriovoracaceae bacterium]|nr:nucleoside hydrolase [Bacteriovoracaceae bacterium]
RDPAAINRFASIISMGGNHTGVGNCSEFAEFNFWVDPESVQVVFSAVERPITMVGLDVTRSIVLTPAHRDIIKEIDDPIADFIYKVTQFYVDFHLAQEGLLGCVINDPLAIAQFIDPSICSGLIGHLEMITEGEHFGRSLITNSHEKLNVEALTTVDSNRFFDMFFKRVLPKYSKLLTTAQNS